MTKRVGCRQRNVEAVVSEKVDSSSAASCNGGRSVRQRQGKRGRLPSCLPPAYETLLNFYEAVDSVLCFLVKNRIPTKVSNLQSMMSKTYNGIYGNNETILMQLRSIVTIAEGVVRFERVSKLVAELDDGGCYLSVVFSNINGTGAARRSKRLKLVREGLENYYLQSQGSLPPPPSSSLHCSSNMPGLPPPADLPRYPEPKKKSEDSLLIPPFSTGTMKTLTDGDEEVETKRGRLQSGKELVSYLQTLPFYKDQIVHMEFKPPQSAVFSDLENPLPRPLVEALQVKKGISRFYQHQAKAINAAMQGKHVAISTATSSGKSMIFNIPVLSSILSSPPGACIALYLYPTKALAQDQLRHLKNLVNGNSQLSNLINLACVDGDTEHASRSQAAASANILLSNPDFLHAAILPNHKRWSRVLKGLRFLVLDESHTYKGAFGAHVSCVMKRMLRLHSVYSNRLNPLPQFICCSATMENTEGHFSALLPLKECLGGKGNLCCIPSKDDAAPQSGKTLLLWRPPSITTTNISQECSTPVNVIPRGGQKYSPASSNGNHHRLSAQCNAQCVAQQFKEGTNISVSPFPRMVGTMAAAGVNASIFSNKLASSPLHDNHDMMESSYGGGGRGVVPATSSGIATTNLKQCLTLQMASTTFEPQVVGGRDTNSEKQKVGEDGPPIPYDDDDSIVDEFSMIAGGGGGSMAVMLDDDAAAASPEDVRSFSCTTTAEESGESEELVRRTSPILETAMLFSALVKQGIRTLAFCHTRKLTELVLQYALQDLQATADPLVSTVMAYRGGYTKSDRRSIESKLFSGKLLGVTATCALELGIDVGDIDATLHLGFPGSISSFWQQAGRAGRGRQESLAIMVLFQDPISNYFSRLPEELFHEPPEAVIIDSSNELVLRSHLICAAAESPLEMTWPGSSGSSSTATHVVDMALFGGPELYHSQIEYLSRISVSNVCTTRSPLVPGPNGTWIANPGIYLRHSPTRDVSLRIIDPITFEVVNDSSGGTLLDHVEYGRAFFCLFEGAIWLNQAKQYKITRLDIVNHVAHAVPVNVQYFTSSRNNTTINVTKIVESDAAGLISTGCVDIVDMVYGYVKCWRGSGKAFEHRDCSLPPLEYVTRAFWIDICPAMRQAIETAGGSIMGGVHAAAHAILTVMTLILTVDPSDMDCEHARIGQARPRPTRIVVFDKCPGGLGISDAIFSHRGSCLRLALDLLKDCTCHGTGGCPKCVASHSCADYNSVLDKNAAIIMLSIALQAMEDHEEPSKQKNDLAGVITASVAGGGSCCSRERRQHVVECRKSNVTPKKQQRNANLVAAKSMDDARSKSKGVRRGWIDSDHNFISENA